MRHTEIKRLADWTNDFMFPKSDQSEREERRVINSGSPTRACVLRFSELFITGRQEAVGLFDMKFYVAMRLC
jgi:hypothetical protein